MREFIWSPAAIIASLAAASYIGFLEPLLAQEQANPALDKKVVRVTFLPPPLEGTISLGVYTLHGKLVRVLASEATEEKFTIGLNGLIIDWDGKDDSGNILPAGKYFLRGFAVGDLGIEGVAFHGNDWIVDEDSPRIRELAELRVAGAELLIAGIAPDGELIIIHFDPASSRHSFERVTAGNSELSSPAATELAVSARRGGTSSVAPTDEQKEARVWMIETLGEGTAARRVVSQRAGNEVLRQLEIPGGEPQPMSVAAATDRDEIYLLERDHVQVRVRGLRLKETGDSEGKKVSQWEVFLSKSIRKSDTFREFVPQFRRTPPFNPEEKVLVRLVSNPLLQVQIASLPLAAAIDRAGSLLRSLDGLPLVHLTTTPNLKWAVLGRGPENQGLTILQSDGAVVEEFRIGTPANIMAFDAGEYEWNGVVK